MQYRADIDGLRAVAVLAVVLFHARLDAFSGGFVGVDVFFVISGYLITGIILDRGKLTREFFFWFYERRIRRLFPPLIPVLLFTSVLAYSFSPPDAMVEYGRSLVASLTFWSNWFFWSISGYFDGPAQSKPLLHTWSLSVEEQFYILFPPVILFASRLGRAALAKTLAAIMAVSLCISAATVWAGHTDLAFYNSLGRFWEIALGSLLAAASIPRPTSETTRSVVGSSGLVAILLCVFLYDETTLFPTVIPAFGAALIIYANGGLAGRVLSARPMVGLGLVSYAIYLWHWPVFVFIRLHPNPTPIDFGVGIAATLILAVLSYFLIELPMRQKRVLPARRSIYIFFASVGSALASLGIAAAATGGLPVRFPGMEEYNRTVKIMRAEFSKASLRGQCWVGGMEDMGPTFATCVQPKPAGVNVLIAGSSHAAQFYAAFSDLAPEVNFDLLAVDSCVIPRGGGYPGCNQIITWIRDHLATAGYDHMVVSAFGLYTNQDVNDLLATAAEIAKHTPVTILGPIPYYQPNLPTTFPLLVGTKSADQMDAAFDDAVRPEQFEVDAAFRKARLPAGVNYVSLLAILCPLGPRSCSHFDRSGLPILIDDSHLSLPASAKLISDVASELPFMTARPSNAPGNTVGAF